MPKASGHTLIVYDKLGVIGILGSRSACLINRISLPIKLQTKHCIVSSCPLITCGSSMLVTSPEIASLSMRVLVLEIKLNFTRLERQFGQKYGLFSIVNHHLTV